ncbi:MAG: hypothetical protein PVG49_22000, partial [Desulfobacteraceae bacterium]
MTEESLITGHPAQEQNEAEQESGEERAFQTEEEAAEAFNELSDQVLTTAEKEAQLLEEEEEIRAREDMARTEEEYREKVRARKSRTLEQINELDPDEDSYDEEVARVLADETIEIEGLKPTAPKAAAGPSHADIVRAQGFVDAEAIRCGIDPQDETFRKECAQAPAMGSLKDQVKG